MQLQENQNEDMNALKKKQEDLRNWLEDVFEKAPNLQVLSEIEKRFFKPVIPTINALAHQGALKAKQSSSRTSNIVKQKRLFQVKKKKRKTKMTVPH